MLRLIRHRDAETAERLTARAPRNGRSLESEVKAILEAAVDLLMAEVLLLADAWRAWLAGGQYSDSAAQLREDRDR